MVTLTPAQRAKYDSLQDGKGTAEKYKQLILAGKEGAANALVKQNPVAAPAAPVTPFENGQAVKPPTFGSGVAGALPPPSAMPPLPDMPGVPPKPDASKLDFGNTSSVAGFIGDQNDFNAAWNSINNRPDQAGPYGSTTYTTGPDGRPIQKTKLADNMQGLSDAQIKTGTVGAGVASGLLTGIPKTYDQSGVNAQYGIPTGDEAQRTRIEDSTYQRLTKNQADQKQKALDAKTTELANRGIPYNSPQWNDQLKQLNDQFDASDLSAHQAAVQMGGDELQRTYGMGLSSHQTALSDYDQQFTLPSTVAAGLNSIGQVKDPSVIPFSTVERGSVDAAALASLDQAAEQFAKTHGLDQQQLAFLKKQWRDEAGRRAADTAAVGRSNRGGGGGGGSGSAASTDPGVAL